MLCIEINPSMIILHTNEKMVGNLGISCIILIEVCQKTLWRVDTVNIMTLNEQKSVFKRIALGSIRNMLGFAVAVAITAYLAGLPRVHKPALLLAAIIVLIMLITANALILFTFYTLRSIPDTMRQTPDETFKDIYGYTLAGIAIRLAEIILYIYLIVYLYRIFFI